MSWVPMSGQEKYLFRLLMRQRDLPQKTLARSKQSVPNTSDIGQSKTMEAELLPHLPLVILFAKKFRGYAELAQLDFLDLLHEGFLGLMNAHMRFDPKSDYNFIVYARWRIIQSLTRAIDASFSRFGTRVPTGRLARLWNLDRTIRDMTRPLNRVPEREEIIAEWMRIEGASREETIRLIDDGARRTASLSDGHDFDDDDYEKGSGVVVAALDPNPEDVVINANTDAKLLTVLEQLDASQKQVVYMRYGLNGHSTQSVARIAESLRLSKRRVCELESTALNRLRKEFGIELIGKLESS